MNVSVKQLQDELTKRIDIIIQLACELEEETARPRYDPTSIYGEISERIPQIITQANQIKELIR